MSRSQLILLTIAIFLIPLGACRPGQSSQFSNMFMTPMAPENHKADQATAMNGVNGADDNADHPIATANNWLPPNKPTSIHYNRSGRYYAASGVSTTQGQRTASQQHFPPQPQYMPTQFREPITSTSVYRTASNSLPTVPSPESNGVMPMQAGSSQFPSDVNADASQPSRRQVIPPIFRTGNNESSTTKTLAPYVGTPISFIDKPNYGIETKIIYRGAAPEKKRPKIILPARYDNSGEGDSDMNDRITMKRIDRTNELVIDPNLIGETHGMYSNGTLTPVFKDEFLADGGDSKTAAVLRNDGILQGLEPEDTVIHFDTIDDQKVVQPSNKVHIYAPRFGSVRKVEGVMTDQRKALATAAGSNMRLVQQHGSTSTQLKSQEQSTVYTRAKDQLESAIARDKGAQTAGRRFLLENSTTDTAMDFSILAKNEWVSAKELPFVAEAQNNAICWSGKQNILIRVNELTLREMHGVDKTQSVFAIDDDNKVTEIRLVKLASTDDALPGETVEFAIRFENTGRQAVRNVTILDSLTTRLEFLSNTAKSSLPASFHVEENEAGSMILRWQMNGEMQPGQSGVVVFKCRVK